MYVFFFINTVSLCLLIKRYDERTHATKAMTMNAFYRLSDCVNEFEIAGVLTIRANEDSTTDNLRESNQIILCSCHVFNSDNDAHAPNNSTMNI